jgi:hypothetical protein
MLLVQMRLSWWNGGTRQMMLLPQQQQQHLWTRQRLETSGRVTGFWIFCLLVWSLPLSSLGSFTSMYPHENPVAKRKKKRKEQKHFSGVDDWEAASKLMVFSTCTGTILSARISTLGVRVFLLSALMFILVAELHQTF